ncbi:MAG: EamA family transporter [Janthinobacterium lividum]
MGVNFMAIKLCLETFPPFFQLALRFFLVSVPLIFFVKIPKGDWQVIFKFSFFLWTLQLSFINLGLKYGVPAGMFSLLIQTKTAVVLVLSMIFFQYYPRRQELIGVIIAFIGIGLIVGNLLDQGCSLPYLFIIPAILSVSCANLVFKGASCTASPLAITVWCAFITFFPMIILSLCFEGVDAMIDSFEHSTVATWIGMFYNTVLATLVGTSLYVFLLNKYGPEQIVPFNLMVPLFGLTASWIVYNEQLTFTQWIAAFLILGGLLINQIRNPRFLIEWITIFKRKISHHT